MASVKITFIGHASFRFESEKSVTYFDPWLDSNPTAEMTLGQIKKADIVIASHGHRDHFIANLSISPFKILPGCAAHGSLDIWCPWAWCGTLPRRIVKRQSENRIDSSISPGDRGST